MQSRVLSLSIVTLSTILFSCAHQRPLVEKCDLKVRALFDVGSGLSKVNVSEVEVCESGTKVTRVLDEKIEAPLFLEAGKDKKGNFTTKTLNQAVKVIAELRDKALASAHDKAPEVKTVEFVAVGTHAVRTAGNSAALIKKIEDLGFKLVPLSQDQEGEMAFRGVLAKGRPEVCGTRQLVVWDAGGGSQQLTRQNADGKFQVVPVNYSSEVFRQALVKKFGAKKSAMKCSNGVATPNPIGASNFSTAEKLSMKMAKPTLKEFKVNAQEQCLVGVGGVHTKSIEAKLQNLWPQLRGCACGEATPCEHTPHRYSRSELACLAKYLSTKSDCDPEIQGPFSPVTVSNGFMILGFLEELETEEVHTLSVNMGNQMITDSTLPWKEMK